MFVFRSCCQRNDINVSPSFPVMNIEAQIFAQNTQNYIYYQTSETFPLKGPPINLTFSSFKNDTLTRLHCFKECKDRHTLLTKSKTIKPAAILIFPTHIEGSLCGYCRFSSNVIKSGPKLTVSFNMSQVCKQSGCMCTCTNLAESTQRTQQLPSGSDWLQQTNTSRAV